MPLTELIRPAQKLSVCWEILIINVAQAISDNRRIHKFTYFIYALGTLSASAHTTRPIYFTVKQIRCRKSFSYYKQHKKIILFFRQIRNLLCGYKTVYKSRVSICNLYPICTVQVALQVKLAATHSWRTKINFIFTHFLGLKKAVPPKN